MTCASCAARIEKRLNKLDGVEATVNFATEEAKVRATSPVAVDDLVAAVEAAGYRAHVPGPPATSPERVDAHDHGVEDARQRLVVSAILSLPVIALGMFPILQFDHWQWLSLTLAAPVVTWGAWPFHRAAWTNLRHAAATMDTLVSIGVLAAFGWSLYALFVGDAGEPDLRHGFSLIADRDMASSQIFLEVAAGVTTFILAGRYLETRAKRNAGRGTARAARARRQGRRRAATSSPGAAQTTVEQRIAIDDLVVGDRFVVRPGEKVAADGVVEEGSSAIDASLVTGEPVPIEVGPGDTVTGGTVNAGGRLVVRAVRVGSDTKLAQIARLVHDAQAGKAPVQRLADRVAAVFVPTVIAVAAGTLGFWLGTGESASVAVSAAVAVLIIACPCALGLATPTAIMVGTGRGAQLGIIIKGPEVLESTRTVDTIVLDKTGTVTTGDDEPRRCACRGRQRRERRAATCWIPRTRQRTPDRGSDRGRRHDRRPRPRCRRPLPEHARTRCHRHRRRARRGHRQAQLSGRTPASTSTPSCSRRTTTPRPPVRRRSSSGGTVASVVSSSSPTP